MPLQTPSRRLSAALAAGGVAAVAVLSSAVIGARASSADRHRAVEANAAAWSARAADAVTRQLDERRRDLELLAALPDIVHAARAAAVEAKRRGLQGRPVAVLERELDASRALSKDARVAAALASWRATFGFTELSFTERDGYSVLGTERTPDFVQSDEDWWQRAFADGFTETAPQYDPSAGVTIQLAARISDPVTHAPMGVLKATLPLATLRDLVMTGAPRAAVVELIDSRRRIIVSGDSARLLREVADSLPPLASHVTNGDFPGPVAAAPAHGGRWWVTTRASADADEPDARQPLYDSAVVAGAVVFLLVLTVLAWSDRQKAAV